MSRKSVKNRRSRSPRRSHEMHRLGFEVLEDRSLLVTFTVDTSSDTVGPNEMSLHKAILEANAAPGPDTIKFAIAGTGPHEFRGVLPTITEAVEIDGWSQGHPGYTGPPLLIVDGNSDNPQIEQRGAVLKIWSGGVTVRGLVITDTGSDEEAAGVLVYIGQRQHQSQNPGGNRIEGCFIGTDSTGTRAVPGRNEHSEGIVVSQVNDNIIGGSTPGTRNVIAGNFIGINLFKSNGNQILGNYIGTDATGTVSLGNQFGVLLDDAHHNVIGGTGPHERNVIAGNNIGIALGQYQGWGSASATFNVVFGNDIGLNAHGDQVGNTIGVHLGGPQDESETDANVRFNVIGGATFAERNVISGNTLTGVQIVHRANFNVVQGNFIGTDKQGAAERGNRMGLLIDSGAHSNVVGGWEAGTGNVVSGNRFGVAIEGEGTTNNHLWGNLIGTDQSGTAVLADHKSNFVGVIIQRGADGNFVGGSEEGSRNTISGNDIGVAIEDEGTTGNKVWGNYIGTNKHGTARLADGMSNETGVLIHSGATGNFIGGTEASEEASRNVISGNLEDGVVIEDEGTENNEVLGNYIGTNQHGTARLENGASNNWGVTLRNGAKRNIIGTKVSDTLEVAARKRNIISGNLMVGVVIKGEGTEFNTVTGNYIGPSQNGISHIPGPLNRDKAGVLISEGAELNIIGGEAEEVRNVISGNDGAGVEIRDAANINIVVGNYIGTDASGSQRLSNYIGVYLSGTSFSSVLQNVISGNESIGVWVAGGTAPAAGNRIAGNLIGTNKDGTTSPLISLRTGSDLGNDFGILLFQADGTSVGEDPALDERSRGNIISGNRVVGVKIERSQRTTLRGNHVALNNRLDLAEGAGVYLIDAKATTLGGAGGTPGQSPGNQIFENSNAGVLINDSRVLENERPLWNQVSGNVIWDNDGDGVKIQNNSSGVTIGDGNSIRDNRRHGISISASNRIEVKQNFIIAGNNEHGIHINNGERIHVSRETIQDNLENGINIEHSWSVVIERSLITGNDDHGINIEHSQIVNIEHSRIISEDDAPLRCRNSDPVTRPESTWEGDVDIDCPHPEDEEHAAVQLRLTYGAPTASTVIEGVLRAAANTSYFAEFFAGRPLDFPGWAGAGVLLGSTTVTTDQNGRAYFRTIVEPTTPVGQSITFSVTGPDGHTSQFAPHVAVTGLPPVDELSIDDVVFVEGDAGVGALELTLTRRNFSDQTVTVEVATADGTASAAEGDYAPLGSFVVTFPPGVIEQKVRVDVFGDDVVEPTEIFSVSLGNPSGGAVIGRGTATATILNDDENSISIGDAAVIEGPFGENALLQVPVSLLNPTSRPITVEVNTADGAATVADGDYMPIDGLIVTFLPGGPLTQMVTIQVPGDNKVEADETITVALSHPTGANVGLGRSTAISTILNDDATVFSIDDETLPEGDGVPFDFVFVLSLSNPSDAPVSIRLDTADGTATAAGGDYHPVTGLVVTFDPGELRRLVTARATGDRRVEADEWFEIHLSEATGANVSIADSTGVGTILNDDTTAFSLSDAMVTEGDGLAALAFTVRLSEPSDAPMSVRIDTADGAAALVDGDYTAIENLVLVFEPGAPLTQTVTVNVSGDLRTESDETIRLDLSNATGANVLIADSTGVGTILDDDADNDGDGVSNKIEDLGPSAGDGNLDGVPDHNQAHVTSIPNALNREYATLVSSPGASLVNIAAAQNPDPLRSPDGIDFPVDFFQYELIGAGIGGAATLTFSRHSTADIVYQFGALTPSDPIPSFYEFPFDGVTGAEILPDRIVLHLVDGARGDRDLSADGVIQGLTGLGRVLGTDLSVRIDDAPDPIGEGKTLTYTLTARNEGPNPATGVILTATLPPGAVFVSATSDQGALIEAGGVVTFQLGSLSAGSAATATVVAQAPGPGLVRATAAVQANESDHRPGNNTVHTDTLVKDIVAISGQKFEDTNGNGRRDPDEVGLNGFTIELVDPGTGDVLMTAVTGPIDLDGDGAIDAQTEHGRYAFDFLVAGAYEVRERIALGFAQTFPSGGTAATQRVSVTSAGVEGNLASSRSSISADGRFVAFESTASNLVPGDTNGLADIFVYDRLTGVIELISFPDSATGHVQSNGESTHPAISPDGRYVAFVSRATNLVPAGDTNRRSDIFVRDRVAGTIERISENAVGEQGNSVNGPSDGGWGPSISDGGRYVAFESTSSNLSSGSVPGGMNVYVKDRLTGLVEHVSRPEPGIAFVFSHSASISADGRFVSFQSEQPLFSDDTNGTTDVFVIDRETATLRRVSVDSAGNQANGGSRNARISADGRFVAFDSGANNLVPGDTNNLVDVFVKDRLTGHLERVSVDAGGNQAIGGLGSQRPFLSGDGRYVAFDSDASNLVPGDTNNSTDVFVYDRQTAAIDRVSVSSNGDQASGGAFFTFSGLAALNGDGRFIAFASHATNLVPNDLNNSQDVFVHDRGGADSYIVTVVPGGEVTGRDFGNQPEHAVDFGDGPDSYGTLVASDGARHFARGPFLGLVRDAELDGQATPDASGDNALGLADEEGVAFTSELVRGGRATVVVSASAPGVLDAWIDFNRNGVFEAATERVASGEPLASGDNVLPIWVPLAAEAGPSFARFRISTAGGLGPTGDAPDGEVEDHLVQLLVHNIPPVALADTYTTDEDVPLAVIPAGILANDADPDEDRISALLDAEPRNGMLVLNADGSFTYTPNVNFHGHDRFAYHVNDGSADSTPTTVAITVLSINDPPVATNDMTATAEDTSVFIHVNANDTDLDGAVDRATVALITQPTHGSLAVHPMTGVITYTPNANFHGTDSFAYMVRDDGGTNSNVATVTVIVDPVNDPPVAVNDAYSTVEASVLTVPASGLLGNDTDADDNHLTAVLLSGPAHGTLELHADGSFIYIPSTAFSGIDSFTYMANDGRLDSEAATVTITVTPDGSSGSGEGLTPGFWKQRQHFDSWGGYTQSQSYNAVFGVRDAKGLTLLDALGRGGGGHKALGRHAVAALLNASHPNVDYAYTTAQIIAMVQNAYRCNNFETAKHLLEQENEKGANLSDSSVADPLSATKFTINGGAVQRSNIETLQVRFNQDTNLQALINAAAIGDAVKILRDGKPLGLDVSRFRYDAATFTLTIDVTMDEFGGSAAARLQDGRYRLSLDTVRVTAIGDPANRLTDDDLLDDGFLRFDFHRLLTDWDGDADVDLDDRDRFFAHYGSRTNDPAYDYAFDLNGDGIIDSRDSGVWKQRLGRRA